jgi:hypothetical protein
MKPSMNGHMAITRTIAPRLRNAARSLQSLSQRNET